MTKKNTTWPKSATHRGTVIEHIMDVSPGELEGSIEHIIAQFQEWITSYGPCLELEYDKYRHEMYDSEPSPRYYLKRVRPESDLEMADRLREVEDSKKKRRENDLVQLAALQKRLGIE